MIGDLQRRNRRARRPAPDGAGFAPARGRRDAMGIVLAFVGIAATLWLIVLDAISPTRVVFLDTLPHIGRSVGLWAIIFLPAAIVAAFSRLMAGKHSAPRTVGPIVSGAVLAALIAFFIGLRMRGLAFQ